MLSDAEILRALKTIRFSSSIARYGRHIPSMNGIAQAAGISRMHLYRVTRGEPLTPRVRRQLAIVLTCNAIDGAKTGGRPAGPDRG